ncbi:MAG: hypothetical protein AAGA23_07190 [Pseudomonadota bacterium]
MSRAGLTVVGLILWRGGLVFAAASLVYYGAWQTLKVMPWPMAIKIGAGLAAAGTGCILVSLLLERRRDAREEGQLKDELP